MKLCTKCECVYPKNEGVCPVCKKKKNSSGLIAHLAQIAFGGVLISSGMFQWNLFAGLISSALFFTLLILEYKKFSKWIEEAKNNGGYFLSEKAQGIRSKTVQEKNAAVSTELVNQYHLNSYSDNTNDFKKSLSIVWADDDLTIEFSYKDSKGDRSRRTLDLGEVSVNKQMELYFIGVCHSAMDNRAFKFKRITSKIKYLGKVYDKESFLIEILSLSPHDFS